MGLAGDATTASGAGRSIGGAGTASSAALGGAESSAATGAAAVPGTALEKGKVARKRHAGKRLATVHRGGKGKHVAQAKRQRTAQAPRKLKKHRRSVNVLRGASVERVLVPQSSRLRVVLPRALQRHAGRSRLYTVRRGDTLWGIARRTLGDGRRYGEIHALNARRIRNAHRIRAGQRIVVPA